jgi:hypothetical protein
MDTMENKETGWRAACDCVVILGGKNPDTITKYIKNEYLKAIYPARPIVVVCPCLKAKAFSFAAIDAEGINALLLRVYKRFGPVQAALINEALLKKYYIRPLLWVKEPLFAEYFYSRYAAVKLWDLKEDEDAQRACGVLNMKNCAAAHGFPLFLNAAPVRETPESRLNVLMLCDGRSLFTNTVREYIEAFRQKSFHCFHYADARTERPYIYDLNYYDAIVIHYSVRMCQDGYLSGDYKKALRTFGGYKILIMQDEYDNTEIARRNIKALGVHEIFSVVPADYIDAVYPKPRFPFVRFHYALTGYVTDEMKRRKEFRPLSERKMAFIYRGRPLGYWYGVRGREKTAIGRDMKAICEARTIPCDIEWKEAVRIYGTSWNDFISSGRAMLASESGANIFDYDGSLRKKIERGLRWNPQMTFEEAFERFLKDREGEVPVNALSPKMFEAISHKTALVMYEGYYSGVFLPDIHYIPLKKDYSNIDEVIEKVMDDAYIEELTRRAFDDGILSGRYDYDHLVRTVDRVLREARVFHTPSIIHNVDLESKLLARANRLLRFFRTCRSFVVGKTRKILYIMRIFQKADSRAYRVLTEIKKAD